MCQPHRRFCNDRFRGSYVAYIAQPEEGAVGQNVQGVLEADVLDPAMGVEIAHEMYFSERGPLDAQCAHAAVVKNPPPQLLEPSASHDRDLLTRRIGAPIIFVFEHMRTPCEGKSLEERRLTYANVLPRRRHARRDLQGFPTLVVSFKEAQNWCEVHRGVIDLITALGDAQAQREWPSS
jgi:hypothetical protein